jgi:glucose-1-phosphate cytidylyltransferase
MQVVILCGGPGTRIRDVADDVPKPMIQVGGRPILWHIMKIYSQYGYTDFVLCLGYKGWLIKRYFLDYHLADADFTVRLDAPGRVEVHGAGCADNWNVTLAETGLDSMTGYRIKRIEKYITGDDFLLTYGDGVADVEVPRLVDFHKKHGKVGTVTAVRVPGRFGEIEMDGVQVTEFAEKPVVSRGRINGGFFVLRRELFDRLEDDPGQVFEQAPLTELARDGELMAYLHNGFWHPMDTLRDHKYLTDLWYSGKAPWRTWDLPLRAEAA